MRVIFYGPLIVFLILAAFLWKSLSTNPQELPSALINKPAPVFKLSALNISNHTLTEKIFKGQVSLLNVWASWCLSCQKEHAFWLSLQPFVARHKLLLVGLNIHDDRKTAAAWIKVHGDPYHAIIFDQDGHLGMDYGIYGTPETFVIDDRGIIRYRYSGPIDQKIWTQKILPLIQKLQAEAL